MRVSFLSTKQPTRQLLCFRDRTLLSFDNFPITMNAKILRVMISTAKANYNNEN